MDTSADTVPHLAAAIVGNFPSHFSLFCGHCWTEGRVSQRANEDWSDSQVRTDAAKHFYSIGWRFDHTCICPAYQAKENY